MRLLTTIITGCVLALCVQPSAVRAQQDDAAACGRKAVAEGVGPGQVNDYVARCVAERRDVRAEDRDRSAGKEKSKREAAHEQKSGDMDKARGVEQSKAKSKVKDVEKSADKAKSKAGDAEASMAKSKDKGKKK